MSTHPVITCDVCERIIPYQPGFSFCPFCGAILKKSGRKTRSELFDIAKEYEGRTYQFCSEILFLDHPICKALSRSILKPTPIDILAWTESEFVRINRIGLKRARAIILARSDITKY